MPQRPSDTTRPSRPAGKPATPAKIRHVVGNAATRTTPEREPPANGTSDNGGDWLAEATPGPQRKR